MTFIVARVVDSDVVCVTCTYLSPRLIETLDPRVTIFTL